MPVIHEFREMFQIVFHGFGVLFDTAELLNSKFGYLRFIVFDFLNKYIKILNASPVLDSSSDEKRSISFKRFSCNSLAFIRCETK